MDDVNGAFEHQLCSVLQEAAGPSMPVDVAAVVLATTTTPGRLSSITRRMRGGFATPVKGGFSMFSALKFIAAGVIVALFGGFLLSGVFTTQQSDEMAPAAVTESPSPMTTEELLSGMVTEEIEPGVVRIISDGAGHDLDETILEATATRIEGIAIAPDGTVWLTTTSYFDDNSSDVNDNDEGSRIWALGQPGTYTHEHGLPTRDEIGDLAILADGTLLAIGDHVLRLDDDRFVPDDGPMLRQMADGGLLLLMGGADLAHQLSEGEVASIRDLRMVWETPSGAGWTTLGDHGRWSVGYHRCGVEPEPRGWSGGDEGVRCGWGWGPFTTYLVGTSIHRLAAAPDGSVWAVGEYDGGPGLYRITPPPAE